MRGNLRRGPALVPGALPHSARKRRLYGAVCRLRKCGHDKARGNSPDDARAELFLLGAHLQAEGSRERQDEAGPAAAKAGLCGHDGDVYLLKF